MFNKRSVGSTHSSHGNLSQASITSGDVLSGDEVDSPLHRPAKISEQRSNSSTDIPGNTGLTVHSRDDQGQTKIFVLSRLQTVKEIPLMPAYCDILNESPASHSENSSCFIVVDFDLM